jgi:hypothetical protein
LGGGGACLILTQASLTLIRATLTLTRRHGCRLDGGACPAAVGNEEGAGRGVRQGEDRTNGPDRLRAARDDGDEQGGFAVGSQDDGVDRVVAAPDRPAAGLAADLDEERVRHPEREQAEQQRRENRMPPAGDRGQGRGAGEQRETTDGPDVPAASLRHIP